MKNATKLIWLLMLFASSIVFAFGQTGANKMTTEQKLAFENSVTAVPGTFMDMAVKKPINTDGKAVIFTEGFDTGIPGSWTQIQYSGTGLWYWSGTIGPSYGQPPGDANYATADSDWAGSGVWFDVGLFTPSLNMTGSGIYLIDLDRNFQSFAGWDLAEIRVHSGSMSNVEEVLFSSSADDPLAGVHVQYEIHPTSYSDPSDVYLEFFYETVSGTYLWNFAIDNVEVYEVLVGEVYGHVYNGGGLTITGAEIGHEATGIFTTSWPDGHFNLPNVPSGLEDIYGTKAGYNTIVHNVNVPVGGSVMQDFILTAPTMIISPTVHEYTLNPEEYYTATTGILNTGDGNLHWNGSVMYPVTDAAGNRLSTYISSGPYTAPDNTPVQGASEFRGPASSSVTDAFVPCDPASIWANEPTSTYRRLGRRKF